MPLDGRVNAVARAAIFCSIYAAICNGFLFGLSVRAGILHTRLSSSPFNCKSTRRGSFSSESCASSSSVKDDEVIVPVLYTATVDYSAVNEYAHAHYNQSQLFDSGSDSSQTVEHQIFDGRILQSCYSNDQRGMLNDNGLAIVQSPLVNGLDWTKVEDIQSLYLPELEKILHDIIFPSSKILSYTFWNPMMRGESYQISREERDEDNNSSVTKTPTASIASLVHIDTDVGAFSIHELLNIVEKNKVPFSSDSNSTQQYTLKDDVADAIIHKKKRFAIVNFWRNIGDEPVSRAPLAILSTKYDKQQSAFPNARPNMEESKWYVFPNATKDEVVVFYQYDRNVIQPSDLFHCAISPQSSIDDMQGIQEMPPRRSFDIRALVVLDESVSEELDRFTPRRTRPDLSFEESGCFCDEQATKRSEEESIA